MKRMFIALMVLSFTLLLQACTLTIDPKLDSTDLGLAVVRDYEELVALVKLHEESSFNKGFFNDAMTPETSAPSVDASNDGSDSFSKTNVQVEGVDEGDIIKTDGNRIYRIDYDRLLIVDVNGLEMEVVLNEVLDSTRDDNSHTYYSDLYISNNQLIVIGQRYQYYLMTRDGKPYVGMMDFWYSFGLPEVIVMTYDLDTLEKTNTISVSGYYKTTRIIDDVLYVLTNQDIYTYNDDIDPRPVLSINDSTFVPSYEDIKYIPDTMYQAFTVITTIPLSNPSNSEMDIYLGVSNWGQTYVSTFGIYFASNTYFYDEVTNTYTSQGHLVSYIFDEDGQVSFGGKAIYEGYILNQFAMDQYQRYMRLVTTDGWGDSVVNRLYVFEHETNLDGANILTLRSLLDEGIGKPRERVQSARFNKDMVTVVTFEQTDPLYIIDLSNPLEPVITSEIEVTGYGTYQHPWGDGLLLVIGYETNEAGQIIGLKVSLFDTSDIFDIKEVGTPYVILNEAFGWNYSEALHNHKAMLIDVEKGLFGFSTSRYQPIINTRNDSMYMSYEFISNYLVFTIDATAETQIQLEVEITHIDILANQEELNYYYGAWAYHIERAVYVGSTLYTVSRGAIKSHDMLNNYETGSIIVFDQYMNE